MHALDIALQIAYFLIAFGVICMGVFGIAATKSERMNTAEEVAPRRTYMGFTSREQRIHQTYRYLTQVQLWWTVLCAAVWPIGIPLYLAWKKGSFINDVLEKREELHHGPNRTG
jgi:hypothetical protein